MSRRSNAQHLIGLRLVDGIEMYAFPMHLRGAVADPNEDFIGIVHPLLSIYEAQGMLHGASERVQPP